MIVIDNNHVSAFDVDETLMIWNVPTEAPDSEVMNYKGLAGIPHMYHINELIALKTREDAPHSIMVWSQAGWEHARDVVEFLNLSQYVDLIITKPQWIFDDLMPQDFLSRVYKKEKTAYGVYNGLFWEIPGKDPSDPTQIRVSTRVF